MKEELREKLFNKKEIGWNCVEQKEKEAIFSFSTGYIDFLNKVKTEREAVKFVKELALQNGYKDIADYEELKPGDKVFFVNYIPKCLLSVFHHQQLK